ncbi:3-oxoacyl-[acyl-carrier-protein] reductase FabG [Lachnellula suecica]|uniref:3-oxoacyl-[acyl-carrier-protein] reductase FabG n=1 Tax=Lachnellula suecica TaxID=602035 RepID=A0A8T9CFZ1_9HELO|nr:3-oxoacyl-[acyl-carrier-protein] reductase FabG [Lachnellula suecica]
MAVVTGASRGIGATIALTLAAKGIDVAIVFTSESSTAQAEAVSKQISDLGQRALLIRTDLTGYNCGNDVRDKVLRGFSTDKIDFLVNNAGITGAQDSLSIQLEQYERMMNINLRAPMLLVKALVPHMNRGGRIISMSSVLAREPYPGMDAYVASKVALEGLTRQWAVNLARSYGITANAIICGAVQTEMIKGTG